MSMERSVRLKKILSTDDSGHGRNAARYVALVVKRRGFTIRRGDVVTPHVLCL